MPNLPALTLCQWHQPLVKDDCFKSTKPAPPCYYKYLGCKSTISHLHNGILRYSENVAMLTMLKIEHDNPKCANEISFLPKPHYACEKNSVSHL